MRERPIADLVDGLKQLDAEVHCFLGTKCPPVQIVSKGGLPGGKVDILNWKYLFLPLEWIGMNAMLVYVMAAAGIFAGFINGWYYEDPHNTLNGDHLHGYNDAEVKLIALLVRHHRRKLPEYDHVVPEE